MNRFLKSIKTSIQFCQAVNQKLIFHSTFDMLLNVVQPFALLFATANVIEALTNSPENDFLISLLIFGTITGGIKIVQIMHNVRFNLIVNETDVKSGLFFAEHLLKMNYEKFESNDIRDLQQKVRYSMHPNNIVLDLIMPFLENTLKVIGYFAILLTLNPLLIIAILTTLVFKHFAFRKGEDIRFDFQKIAAEKDRKLDYLFNIMSHFNWAKEIKINRLSTLLTNRYTGELSAYNEAYKQRQRDLIRPSFLNVFIDFMQMLIQYGYSAYQAFLGVISIGQFTIYLGSISQLSTAFNELVRGFSQLRTHLKAVDEYHEYLELAGINQEAESGVSKEQILPHSACYEIEFRDISFKYPNAERYALKNVSLKISYGERLLIAGYNGAGKSTIIKLLCRLYKPTEGTILCNGVDIQTLSAINWRQTLSVVLQDFQIFSFPVWENVALDRPYDEMRIRQSLQKSGLGEKIDRLEFGINTEVSKRFHESGIEFSGGESQKLACARSYYKDGEIIILDEPTAALDPKAESELYQRFNSIIGNKTAIYVTHRLASASFCNKIALFSNGELVEYGDHDQLMNRQGIYRDMYVKQAHYYAQEVG